MNLRPILLSFILFFFGISISTAEILKVEFCSNEIIKLKRWQVLDVSFNAKSAAPFKAEFYAIFTSPSGKEQKVPGFYNGDKEWILRFSGSELGFWTYRTIANVKALNGKKSSIELIKKREFEQKGAIIIPKEDPQHFYYEDGTPYFLMAFECDWLYALDYHNEDGIPKTEHMLNLIKENGFNKVVMNVFSYDVNWKWGKDSLLAVNPEHEFGGPKGIFPFLGNNDNPDFSALNIEFFKKLDRTISLMHDKNIVSHLMIYVWNKMVSWPEMYADADNMYYDYVIKRYGAFPNVMWDVSKEALHYNRADDTYILDRIERFQNQNYFNRTLTVHDYEFCIRHPETVDYIARQDWTFELYNNMIDDYNKYSNMPIFNIEHGGYEESPYVVFSGSYINAEVCLRRNYQCAFAGAYSTYYWQGTSWNAIIWNPFNQEEYFHKPQYQYFKHFTKLFADLDYTQYKPLPEFSREGYCMKEKGKESFIYSVPKEVYWHVPKAAYQSKPDSIYYQWYNTYTGEYSKEFKKLAKSHVISPWYGKADAVLIIREKRPNTKTGEDYVLLECESTESHLGLWEMRQITDTNYLVNASAQSYIEFTGNTKNGGTPKSPLEYTFTAPNSGTYTIAIRGIKRLEGEPHDKCNDAYIKLVGEFESGNSVPKENLTSFTKL